MRRDFSKPTKRDAYDRAGGICECPRLHIAGVPGFTAEGCGQRLSAGNTFYEHIIQDNLGGKPTLDNCAALVKTCWRLKTDTIDLPVIAKANRQQDLDRGIDNPDTRPMPCGKNSRFKSKVGGGVVDRQTGVRL